MAKPSEAALKRARQRLVLWGAREQERLVGGNSGAMPRKSEVLQTGPGIRGNGKPGDLPASMHDTMDVDLAIAAWNEDPFIRNLLEFVYRDGIGDKVVEVEYTLRDGSAVTLKPGESEPKTAKTRHEITQRRFIYDLQRFPDPVLDRDLGRCYPRGPRFRIYRKRFLESVLNDFIEHLASGWC